MYSSFVLGAYNLISGVGEGIFCGIEIDASDYTHSVWKCKQVNADLNTLTLNEKGSIEAEGSGV